MELTIKQKVGAFSVLVIAVVTAVLMGIFYSEKQEVIVEVTEDGSILVADPEGGVYPVNELLISVVEGAELSDLEELVYRVNGEIILERSIQEINLYVLRLETQTIEELQNVRDILERDEIVEYTITNNVSALQ